MLNFSSWALGYVLPCQCCPWGSFGSMLCMYGIINFCLIHSPPSASTPSWSTLLISWCSCKLTESDVSKGVGVGKGEGTKEALCLGYVSNFCFWALEHAWPLRYTHRCFLEITISQKGKNGSGKKWGKGFFLPCSLKVKINFNSYCCTPNMAISSACCNS